MDSQLTYRVQEFSHLQQPVEQGGRLDTLVALLAVEPVTAPQSQHKHDATGAVRSRHGVVVDAHQLK